MILVRRQIAMEAFGFTWDAFQTAEKDGLSYEIHGDEQAHAYDLTELIRYFQKDVLTKSVVRLLELASLDPKKVQSKGRKMFNASEAMQALERGEIPDFPDASTAQKTTSSLKNIVDARTKEQDRRIRAKDLVEKELVMRQVNTVAGLYEDKFGEKFILNISEQTNAILISIADGAFHEWFQRAVGEAHDEVIIEINRIEAGLTE